MTSIPIPSLAVLDTETASAFPTALVLAIAMAALVLTAIGVIVWRAKQAQRANLRIVLDDNVEIAFGEDETSETVKSAVDTILTVDAEEATRAMEATRAAAAAPVRE